MRSVLVLAMLIVVTGGFAKPVASQQAEHKLVQFQMALLKRGPSWTKVDFDKPPDVIKEHLDYEQSLLKSGKAMIAGRISDDGELGGVYIFRTTTLDEAKSLALSDPAVKAGQFVVEMHPWLSEDVMKKTVTSTRTITAYLVLLTRGPKWTPESTPATEELQKQHIANIVRLAGLKKLVVAGPFADEGTLRGIFVFKVGSLEEAQSLTSTDPAVMAGRLAVAIHPWIVPDGILP